MEDSKLKFLPRHLQRTQPAGSHKSKRRVTLESEEGDEDNDRRKPSVFERLGPGASQRTEKTSSVCFEFQEHGHCQYGKNCPYSHNVKTKGQGKRDDKESSDDLRLKFKGQSGKDRESKVKSQVVVRKAGGESEDESGEDSDNWSIDKLASKKEMDLERKRQEIQRALSALEATEEVADNKKFSDSSESVSSPERPAKKKKEKTSKKEKRKKHKKSASEKDRAKDLKRKHDSDDEDTSQKNQKKRKKKKQKHGDDAQRGDITSVKSSKLLSPLKKVLKQKKKAESVISKHSKRIRSESVESGSRKRHRSAGEGSSSESSHSPSPAKRKKPSAPDTSREKHVKKRSRSLEKKRHPDRRDGRRSGSSSSSSSSSPSSSSSSPSRSRSQARKMKSHAGKDMANKGGRQSQFESQVQVRKDRHGDKKKRDKSADSWNAGKDQSAERSKGRQAAAQHEKMRGVREREDRYGSTVSSKKHDKRNLRSSSKDVRNEGKDGKESNLDVRRPGLRGQWESDNKKDKKRGEVGRERNEDRQEKGERHSRERKESLERQDRMRRGGGFGSGPSFGPQSSYGGMNRDRDSRHFDETSGRFMPDSTRVSMYQGERQKGGSERNDSFDKRDGNDSRIDRGPGRFNRGSDNGEGRGWDDRRHGGDGFTRDEWSGRDQRPFGHYSAEDAREFGHRRDERRGGREERLLPHLGGKEAAKDSRFSQPGDVRNQHGGVGHQEEFNRDRMGARDWKLREGSYDSSSRREAGEADARRSESRDRSRRGASNTADSFRDRPNDRDVDKVKRDASSKISSPSMLSLKTQTAKEDSPLTRDETSLASLFSQTETVAPVKKKTTKSFGGKKSPKKSAEEAKSDKTKSGLATRLATRTRRLPDKKPGVTAPPPKATDDKMKDSDKSDKSKTKPATKCQSPKGSHKSEDSPRSRKSQSKSRRSSKSPDSKRTTSTHSPASNKESENTKSETRLSRSPAPSSGRDRDKRDASQRSPAPSGKRDNKRRREEPKRSEEQHKGVSERSKRRERPRSHSLSEEESHHSADDKKRRRSSDSDSVPAKLEGGDIAAAMLGDGIDDGQQEEKVFSDWSDDDDADTILMGGDSRKTQSLMHARAAHLDDPGRGMLDLDRGGRRMMPLMSHFPDNKELRSEPDIRIEPLKEKPVLEKNIPNVKIVEDIQKEKPARERRRRDTDNEGYEEISSDENDLDEEGEKVNKRTIVSILDIDLTSLIPLVKPKPFSGPVFMRYKAANIFADLGISKKFAGKKLFKEVQETCQKQLEEMTPVSEQVKQPLEQQSSESVNDVLVKEEAKPSESLTLTNDEPSIATKEEPLTEPILSPPDTPTGVDEFERDESKHEESVKPMFSSEGHIKEVKVESEESQKLSFELYSDSCAIHRLLKARAKERAGLFSNSTMLQRALTARRDLDIRRRLCKIPHNYDQGAIYPSGVVDHDLYQMCSQLFKQNRPLTLSAKDLTASC